MEREYNIRTWYRVAYPKAGELSKRRWKIKPPYPGAPRWQCNVYYYWWEFMKRHEGYKRYVADCGWKSGEWNDYREWLGFWRDIHAHDFQTWWDWHGSRMFGEPMPPQAEMLGPLNSRECDGFVTVRIPLSVPYAWTDRRLRRLLVPLIQKHRKTIPASQAEYRVVGKPVLSALHTYLMVYDCRMQHPDKSLAEIADLAGLKIKVTPLASNYDLTPAEKRLLKKDWDEQVKRRKTQEVSRCLRIAKALIASAPDREWPKYK